MSKRPKKVSNDNLLDDDISGWRDYEVLQFD
jgi:hypothetical protein